MGRLPLYLVILVCTAFFWGNTFPGHALDSQQITELIQSARQGDTRAMRKLGRAYSDNVSATGCTRRQNMMPAMKSDRVGFRLVV